MYNNEKQCKNCKKFIPHYINRNGKFIRLNFGHCVLSIRKPCLSEHETCNKWENNNELINLRREKIEVTLSNMAKDLNHIAQILKEEKQL